MNTELGDTLIVEHFKKPNQWIYRGKVNPTGGAGGQIQDTGLLTGVTYTYRVYYRKGSLIGRFSNLDTARPDSIAEPYGPVGP